MKLHRIFYPTLVLLLLISANKLAAQKNTTLERVEPPSWWVNMDYNELQLMVYGEHIASTEPGIEAAEIKILKVHRSENQNYLFLDILIAPEAKAGTYPIEFKGKKRKFKYDFVLSERIKGEPVRQGFNMSDAIYLLMPDRFANGNTDNDNVPDMLEKADRGNPDGRHGGDIEGIRQHLDYISDLGFTTV